MQIWKSANNFTLKHLLSSEICAREICEKFVYKHLCCKINLLFNAGVKLSNLRHLFFDSHSANTENINVTTFSM